MMLASLLSCVALLGVPWVNADFDRFGPNGIDPEAKASFFVYPSAAYVFALNVVANGDVYYHMNAPAYHSWMGVGFGGSMTNSRMLISYRADNGKNLTNSCRVAYGQSEPVYDPECRIDPVWTDLYGPYANTLSPQATLIAHAICRNCSVWEGGALNLTSTVQQFVFALGPNKTLTSDDPAAPLRFHQVHGVFELDMTKATNYSGDYGRVPPPQDPAIHQGNDYGGFANYYSAMVSVSQDSEWAPLTHGVIMCLAFVLIFPVGALSLRLFKRVFIHAVAQAVGLLFVVAGFGVAVHLSKMYNKSKHFSSAHQIIGLFIFAALFIQIGLGLLHHCIYLRTKGPSAMGKVHRFLGLSIILLGLANAGVGFDFAQNKNSNIPYGISVAVVGALFVGLFGTILYYTSRNVYKPEKGVYLPENYGVDFPAEYEMHNAPFARMGSVQTPRTPFFGNTRWDEDDPEDYRSHVQQQRSHADISTYTDTPASERENPLKAKWDAVSSR